MFRIFGALLFGSILGAGLMYSAFSLHVIHADEGVLFFPKQSATLQDIYLDIRGWQAADWVKKPHVAQALIKYDRSDLIKPMHPEQVFQDWMNQFQRTSKQEPQVQIH